MECNECKSKISLYIDKMLDLEESQKLEAHLESCENCMQIYKSTYEMVKTLKEVDMHKLPENFHSNLMSRIKEEKLVKITNDNIDRKAVKNSTNKLSGLKHLASLAAVLLVGFIMFSSTQQDIKEIVEDDKESIPNSRMTRDNIQDDSQMQSICNIGPDNKEQSTQVPNEWYINTGNTNEFIDLIKSYLDERKCIYIVTEEAVEISSGNNEEILKWIEELEIVDNVRVTGDSNPPFKLIIDK